MDGEMPRFTEEEARAAEARGYAALEGRIEAAGFRRSVAFVDWTPLLVALRNCQMRRARGIVVSGRAGCGKTQFLRAVYTVFRSSSLWIPCHDVQSLDWLDWEESRVRMARTAFLLLDDFGSDEPVNVYGTRVDRVARLVMEWSDWPKRYQGNTAMLIVSTNLTSTDVAERYGARVASRLRDLRAVRMVGEDKRGT
jgi:ABC-type glutathione transport system ATPase component